MNSYTREERAAAITPTLAAGLVWLYQTAQPRNALVQPQGIALPAVADRRFIFVPDVGGQGAAVVVHVTTTHRDGDVPAAPSDVLTGEELADVAAAVMAAHSGVRARVVSAPGSVAGHIQLSVKAHPLLLAAVARYRAGCPRHRQPACGYIRNTQCGWFADGFARLTMPTPPPPYQRLDSVVVAPEVPRQSACNVAALGAANAARRERGAARAVAIAGEAIATLSRRRRRSAVTEEALRVLQLRVDHPELSLRELAAAHTPPLTKDSYAARLRRALRAASGDDALVQRGRSITKAA